MPVRTANPLRLALFWLGVQSVWGALLGISLQSRTIELAGASAVLAYGRLATAGAGAIHKIRNDCLVRTDGLSLIHI